MLVLGCPCYDVNIADELKCFMNEYFSFWKMYLQSSLLHI